MKAKFSLPLVVILASACVVNTPTPTVEMSPEASQTASQSPSPVEPTGTPVTLSTRITAANAGSVQELLRLGRGTIEAAALSPNESILAVAGGLGIWLYDPATLEEIALLEGDYAYGVAWSSNSNLLAAREANRVLVWDVKTKQIIQAFYPAYGPGNYIAFSADGLQVITADASGTIWAWSLASSEVIRLIGGEENGIVVKQLCWDQTSQSIISAGHSLLTQRGIIAAWNLPVGEITVELRGQQGEITALACSEDGRRAITGASDGSVWVWDVKKEEAVANITPQNSKEPITALSWESTGDSLIAGNTIGETYFWENITIVPANTNAVHPGAIRGIALIEDRNQGISLWEKGYIVTWDIENGSTLIENSEHRGALTSLGWSHNGDALAIGGEDGRTQIWDTASWQTITELGDSLGHITRVAWSPDDGYLAAGTEEGAFYLWGTDDWGNPQMLVKADERVNQPIFALAWSPDETQLAWSRGRADVEIWDAAKQQQLMILQIPLIEDEQELTNIEFTALSWSPDGALLATGDNRGSLTVWDVSTAEVTTNIFIYAQTVYDLDWSSDGTQLAIVGSDDNGETEYIRIWNRETEAVTELEMSSAADIRTVEWSPDGTLLAVGYADAATGKGKLAIWEMGMLTLLLDVEAHNAVITSLVWSPDGKGLATASRDGTVRVWGVK